MQLNHDLAIHILKSGGTRTVLIQVESFRFRNDASNMFKGKRNITSIPYKSENKRFL